MFEKGKRETTGVSLITSGVFQTLRIKPKPTAGYYILLPSTFSIITGNVCL